MRLRSNRKGFTLLEILIVLVILAVLAGLAVPAYQASVERSRQQEALAGLSAVRDAMTRYFAQNNSYAGAAFGVGAMDFNPNLATGGQTVIFSYSLSNLAAATFTCTASRTGGPVGTVSIDQAGAVSRTGVYA